MNQKYVRCWLVALLLAPLHGQQIPKGNDDIVRIDADNEVHGIIGSKRPYLCITCSADQPAVFLANTYLLEGLEGRIVYFKGLKIKVDDETPLVQNWVEVKYHSRLYSPTPAAFIKQLASAKTVSFAWESWAPLYGPMVFELSRWASALRKLENTCAPQNSK